MKRSVKSNRQWVEEKTAWVKILVGSILYRLPFNRRFQAFNVLEFPIPLEPVLAARELYEQVIEPEIDGGHPVVRSGDLAFYIKCPKDWGSNIRWISCDNDNTYDHFKAVFNSLQIVESIRKRVTRTLTVRIWNAFYVIRSECFSPHFHEDFQCAVRTNAYTLMTPLYDYSQSSSGHLIYKDFLGINRHYTYRLGRAIIFGAGFRHATAPMSDATQRAFLCFTFGSDKQVHWESIYRSIAGQSRLTWDPDGKQIVN